MRNFRILAALPVLVLVIQGCTNTEGKFNAFTERQKALSEGGVNEGGGMEVTPCDPPAPGDLDAEYLFAISASADPPHPILFTAQLKSVAYQGGSGLDVKLQALDAKDRKTPVGAPITIPTLKLNANGTLEAKPLPDIAVSGKANPIQVGLDIVASAQLNGQFCGVSDFYCGTVSGKVTKPITLDLAGSTYAFDLVSDPTKLPDPPLIDCKRDKAGPPP